MSAYRGPCTEADRCLLILECPLILACAEAEESAANAIADARATREHMSRWMSGAESHRGEDDDSRDTPDRTPLGTLDF